jgi:TatD DNase family protein
VARLIDTHAHLCDPAFAPDLEAVLARARAAGVGAIVAVGESLEDAERNLELGAAHADLVRPAAGLFPTRLDLLEAERIEDLIRRTAERWFGIGEVGLDYWRIQEESEREIQREIFGRFIDLARALDLPVNVHSRSAGRAAIELLLARGASRVHLHAFDGRAASAEPAVEAGFCFSVPPSIVRSRQKQKLVGRLPLARLLLETDSPVLGADPQGRNEPANVSISARAIAEIKGVSVREVLEQTTANALALYGDRLLD